MAPINIHKYRTLVFDCDGVVLNSNQVKSYAFYKSALPYGREAATDFVQYHMINGGVSRYKKFEYFLANIAPQVDGPGLDTLLSNYANDVIEGLLSCDISQGLMELREQTPTSRWLIVSGGDQSELRQVFKTRGLTSLFDGGIFGSPADKKYILDRELALGNIQKEALFLGDSKYDFESAKHAELDFLFVSGWSEMSDWQPWAELNKIGTVQSLANCCT